MIDDILDYLNQFIARDGTDDLERRWVAQQTHNAAVQALLPHLRTRDIRIVAAVGQHQPLPQKKLPMLVGTSQATASRAVSRLADNELLIRERMPDNAKEWQLRLTTNGAELARLKGLLDERLHQAALQVASHYTPAELTRFNQLLGELLQLSSKTFQDID
ncbi:MarR family transcriptional regulator [Lacticaseibacillus thailandensis]|uniref:HTH marR-type domain-containing protein n=1 Tax=Lacticaseibacillus thailandensis DSM 22698 = JCM 13996 TaxID=1423810 RepID=A0A0R2C784_9LACO|nr:MarR family transcriptional regulator [Lacticaseibacillus thailandensis]KRM87582.1 hypothetical protein FD19_GL001095 [Lacticaseibacillus thailandensis DSM 22698 = JCM 13996]